MSVNFGADYYPEQWDKSRWEDDARRMQALGLTQIRVMEFAWALVEPEEGQFDFSLFQEVVSLFGKYGIKTVLGTPTATFPIWLYEKDPSITQEWIGGAKRSFGSRRQACFNNKTYLMAAQKVSFVAAKAFAGNPDIVGWQIDNEIGHEGSDRCVCDNCKVAWHSWLEKKYATIENLNKTWGTVFWSTVYSRFDQIQVPKKQFQGHHNPGLLLDYSRFQSDSAVAFTDSLVAIIKNSISPGQWISTDTFLPPNGHALDLTKLFSKMDFSGFNYYPVWGSMNEPLPYFFQSYGIEFFKGLKDKENFTVFEQICGIQGHDTLGYLPSTQEICHYTDQVIAHGANQVFYFRWRNALLGQEQLCYGLLDADNKDTDRLSALSDTWKAKKTLYEKIASSSRKYQACVIWDKDNARYFLDQFHTEAMDVKPTVYFNAGYDTQCATAYAPFCLFNIDAAVKSADSVDLKKYRIISLPAYPLTDDSLVSRLSKWVAAGNTLILHWRTGLRDKNNVTRETSLPGPFAELAGLEIRHFESLNKTKTTVRMGIFNVKVNSWADIIEPVSAKPVAIYSSKKKWYRNKAAATVNDFGKGQVWYIGFTPEPLTLFLLYRKIFRSAGLKPHFYGFGVECLTLDDSEGKSMKLFLNHTATRKRASRQSLPPWAMKSI